MAGSLNLHADGDERLRFLVGSLKCLILPGQTGRGTELKAPEGLFQLQF